MFAKQMFAQLRTGLNENQTRVERIGLLLYRAPLQPIRVQTNGQRRVKRWRIARSSPIEINGETRSLVLKPRTPLEYECP